MTPTTESPGRARSETTEPTQEYVGGSSVRRYLNENLTLELLAGLREVANEKPKDPLRWLGEYLVKRADEKEKTDVWES